MPMCHAPERASPSDTRGAAARARSVCVQPSTGVTTFHSWHFGVLSGLRDRFRAHPLYTDGDRAGDVYACLTLYDLLHPVETRYELTLISHARRLGCKCDSDVLCVPDACHIPALGLCKLRKVLGRPNTPQVRIAGEKAEACVKPLTRHPKKVLCAF